MLSEDQKIILLTFGVILGPLFLATICQAICQARAQARAPNGRKENK